MSLYNSIIGYWISIKELRRTRLKLKTLTKEVEKIEKRVARPPENSKVTLPATSPAPSDRDRLCAPKVKILLADAYHINSRNFPSLFEVMKDKNVAVVVGVPNDSSDAELIKAAGVYDNFARRLSIYSENVRRISKDDLYTLRYRNVPVAELALDEAVAAVLASDHWQSAQVTKSRRVMFDHLWEHDRETLQSACAACLFWTDYWANFPGLNKFDAAVVFSGSYIYGRVLLHLVTYTKAKGFVLESFATGFDFFFEERHTPIANNSRIRHTAYRGRYSDLKADKDLWERHKIRAFNKLRNMKNKNVQQPPSEPLPRSLAGKKIILVLGQVVNDFSLVSGHGCVLSSIPTYREFISSVLDDSDAFVIFKAHPWELKKQNVLSAFTEDAIRTWAETLSHDKRERLALFRDRNIHQLFRVTDHVVTLCSQSALEATLSGLKPITIGGAFYSGAGFTSDFDTPVQAAQAIKSGLNGTLSFDEFSCFEDYLTTLIQGHLCNADASGVAKIAALLAPYRPQKQFSSHQSELRIIPTWDIAEVSA